MAQRGNVYETRSDPTQHFTGTLAPGQSATETIPLSLAVGAGGVGRSWIRQIHLLSVDNLAWEIIFYGKSTFETLDPSLNSYLSRYRFQAAQGIQVVAGGLYHYVAEDQSLPYEDHDANQGKTRADLHVLLINRSSQGTKTGALVLKLLLEPSCGW